jgi:hypothetical protein
MIYYFPKAPFLNRYNRKTNAKLSLLTKIAMQIANISKNVRYTFFLISEKKNDIVL